MNIMKFILNLFGITPDSELVTVEDNNLQLTNTNSCDTYRGTFSSFKVLSDVVTSPKDGDYTYVRYTSSNNDEDLTDATMRGIHIPLRLSDDDYRRIHRAIDLSTDEYCQFVVEYEDIKEAEKLTNCFPGAKIYGNTEPLRRRLFNAYSEHKIVHVFSFSIVDDSLTESYLDDLQWVGKWGNVNTLLSGKVSFIYIQKANHYALGSKADTNATFNIINELRTSGIIEV